MGRYDKQEVKKVTESVDVGVWRFPCSAEQGRNEEVKTQHLSPFNLVSELFPFKLVTNYYLVIKINR